MLSVPQHSTSWVMSTLRSASSAF